MELNEKIRALRQQKGMTQEELAAALYVSRAAVSKWESGRGTPNIDSLKAVSRLFSVTVDDLLSDSENVPEYRENQRKSRDRLLDRAFGLTDLGSLLLLVLPLFAQRGEGTVQAVSLLNLTGAALYVRAMCMAFVLGMAGMGVLLLALRTCRDNRRLRYKRTASLLVHALGVVVMMMTRHAYAAVYLFLLLVVKGVALKKKP